MPSPEDSLAIIAASYRLTAETQQFLAQSQVRAEQTQQDICPRPQAPRAEDPGILLRDDRSGTSVYRLYGVAACDPEPGPRCPDQALIETLERLPKP